MGEILVLIVSAATQTSPPAWHLEYEVRNPGSAPVWLIVDEELVLSHAGVRIELSYARGKMRPGIQPFGYFDPNVVEIPAGKSSRQTVEVAWPCRLSGIWNPVREAALPPGEYEVSVRIGYASTPAPDAPELDEGVEAHVLRWQREAVS